MLREAVRDIRHALSSPKLRHALHWRASPTVRRLLWPGECLGAPRRARLWPSLCAGTSAALCGATAFARRSSACSGSSARDRACSFARGPTRTRRQAARGAPAAWSRASGALSLWNRGGRSVASSCARTSRAASSVRGSRAVSSYADACVPVPPYCTFRLSVPVGTGGAGQLTPRRHAPYARRTRPSFRACR